MANPSGILEILLNQSVISQLSQVKMLTCLYLFKDGVFSGGPENGIDIFVSKNFSDSNPPITVPYLLKATKMLPSSRMKIKK